MAHWFESNGSNLFRNLARDYKRDLIAVEGNAQGFRIISQTENHVFDGGLQLTYAVLGAFHKYPWTSRNPNKEKFGAFISEEAILDRVAEKLGLVRTGQHSWCRHPLAHLIEAADDICYTIIDLEDAVELQILAYDEVEKFLLESFNEEQRTRIRDGLGSGENHRIKLTRLRSVVFDRAISAAIDAYMSAYPEIMQGKYDDSIFDLLEPTDPVIKLVFGAKLWGQQKVYTDTKKTEIEIGCYSSFDIILTEFCSAALNQAEVLNDSTSALKWKAKQLLQLLGEHAPTNENAPPEGWSSYQCLRRVIDFVTGMTDNYAVYLSRQLQGMGFAGVQRP